MNGAAFYPWRFGLLKISYAEDAVTGIARVAAQDVPDAPTPVSDLAYAQITEYLRGKRTAFTFPMSPAGTPFQRRVWQALLAIPYGETRTYGQIALALGNPKATRAVGLANSRNPIAIAIPCHRVIGRNGRLTGYAGGLEMKAVLLELEQRSKL